MTLTPALFTSSAADAADTTKFRPSDLNNITGLLTRLLDGVDANGSVLMRNTASANNGASWLAPGAAGTVLVGAGTTTAPAFSASPSVTALTVPATTSGTTGVLFKGAARFCHNYKPATALGFNTFLGVEAGNFTMDPGGGANTLASYNTGVGVSALGGLTTGYSNTAVGMSALATCTTGYFNTAVGADSMALTTITGSGNTAIGGDSLYSLTSGISNTGVGKRVMWYIQDGDENTAVGVDALYTNVSGDKNVALGNLALTLATGSNNVAVGYNAGANLTTASSCILIGYNLSADSATADGQINIGGVIKGDVGTLAVTLPGALQIGTSLWATAGAMRLTNGQVIGWRDANNTANASIALNSSNQMQFVTGLAASYQFLFSGLTGNSVNKYAEIGIPHYLSAEEAVTVFSVFSDSFSRNILAIGGGGVGNAVTGIYFKTAPNYTTVDGTTRMSIDSAGAVTIAGLSGVGTRAIGADATGKLVVL